MTKIIINYPYIYKKQYKIIKKEFDKNYIPSVLESFPNESDLTNGIVRIIKGQEIDEYVIDHSNKNTIEQALNRCKELFPMNSMMQIDDILSKIDTKFKFVKLSSNRSISNKIDMYIAEDIRSNINIPMHPTSTRDGYAILNRDLDVRKKVIGEKMAGDNIEYSRYLEENSAMYVATGAVVPNEYNCVVMIENVEYSEGSIMIKDKSQVYDGSFIRTVGSDIKNGEILMSKGDKLNGMYESLLIQAGVKEIPVNVLRNKRLSCKIYSTGNEVKSIESELMTESDVYNTNLTLLDTLIKRNNLDEYLDVSFEHLSDSLILSHINDYGLNHDITIFIGGSAIGEHDYSREILARYTEPLCTQINLMPGRPFGVGTYRFVDKVGVMFSLAGNPVSCCVSFTRFIIPYIYNTLQLNNENLRIQGELDYNAINNAKRNELQRVRYKDGKWTLTTEYTMSSNIKSLVNCDGLLYVKAGETINKGEKREIILFHQEKNIISQSDEENVNRDVFKIGILTASDRASKGVYKDESGEKIKEFLTTRVNSKYEVYYECIEDDLQLIENTLIKLSKLGCCLILTTGGTGPSIRDNTIIALKNIIHKELPGFGELMRTENLKQVPTAILSAQTAGIYYYRNRGTLIVNCPGSPKSIDFSLNCVWNAIPYCIELLGHNFMECEPKAFRPNKK